MEFIEIKTYNQILYYLNLSEVVVFKLKDGLGFIEQKNESVKIIIQPNFGKSLILTNNINKLNSFYQKIKDSSFYVCKGGYLKKRDLNILDIFADFINRKKAGNE